MDALLLSRLQFAWVIALHILLPAFTVGLSCFIATLEILWWYTGRQAYGRLSQFWLRIFAVSFGMGVVSGIVMPFQIGTNWSRYVDATSSVIGPFLAYEALIAFFLESAFLGVLLFGRRLVPRWVHAASAVLVAFGTLLSSFWILAVNSWMQTPQGFTMENGRFMPVSILSILFTPSFPYRLAHTVTAFVVTAAFVILAVGASYLRAGRTVEESRIMVRMSLYFLALMVPLQIALGDLHGLNTLHYQPAKLAAMEGLWESGSGVPASLIALPDPAHETNRLEIAIPHLGSVYLTHQWDGYVKGLKDFPAADRPPVAVVYFAFRIMVGMGILMLLTAWSGVVLDRRGSLWQSLRFLRWCTWTAPIGFVAVLAGWTTTEVGRQPWVVYGHLRTADAVTPSLTTGDVALSLSLYVIAYLVIFGGGLLVLRLLVQRGPAASIEGPASSHEPPTAPASPDARAARPLSGTSHAT